MFADLFSTADTASQFALCPDIEFKGVIVEGLDFLKESPEIQSMIEADIDAWALRKKQQRLEDKRWESAHTSGLPLGDLPAISGEDALQLQSGRPRLLDGESVFVLLLARGYYGSLSSSQAVDRMLDSMLINAYFSSRNQPMPSHNCALDNLNAVNNQTRDHIFRVQLGYIKKKRLDEFKLLSIDSFSVEASTCWPTDSGIIMSLLNRVWRCGQKLKDFDLPGFTPGCVEQWLKQLKKIDFAMNCVGGKPGAAKKLRKLYSQYLDVAAKIINRLAGQLEALTVKWEALDIVPSQQRQAEAIMEIVNDDLAAVVRVCEYTGCRIFKNIILPSAEKILSLSDSSAAFIKKGGREPKIGYKPQVARSGNGFITAFELEQGNPADSARLLPVTRQHQRNTGITPNVITVDDGYSSKAGRDELLEEISTVSINGSKGKKITSEEQWNSAPYADARNMRSAVESLVFTLRYKFSLYRFSRRGIEAVKGEMTEKIIVHNFWRIGVIMRKREMDNLASRPPARKVA